MNRPSTATPPDEWLRYTHLEKLYGYLPGMTDATPAVFGLTAQQYRRRQSDFAEVARHAAVELVTDPTVADLVDKLPISAGQRILAVGDSITDDLLSWAEILRHLLALRRGDDGVSVINAGLSAHTSAMILRRWPATVAAAQPDVIICGLGGNDATRVGPDPSKPVVSLPESVANLRELYRIAAARPAAIDAPGGWLWLTPLPVDEDRVRQHPPFRFGQSSWRTHDLASLAEQIRTFPEPVVDVWSAFGTPPDPALLEADGVHPTLAGQRTIALALLRIWAAPQ